MFVMISHNKQRNSIEFVPVDCSLFLSKDLHKIVYILQKPVYTAHP